MENSNQPSFLQFSDNLCLQTGNLANLSLNDSIWSTKYVSKRPAEERRNFDFRNAGGEVGSALGGSDNEPKSNWSLGFSNDVWKAPINETPSPNFNYPGFSSPAAGLNGGSNMWIYYSPSLNFKSYNKGKGFANNFVVNRKINKGYKNEVDHVCKKKNKGNKDSNSNGGFNKWIYPSPSLNFKSYNKGKGFANNVVVNGKINKGYKNEEDHVGKKKNKGNKESNKDNNSNGEKNVVDKRFKTLPPAEALPRNETIGGHIFVCNNDTMAENLNRQLFGLPSRYRDSVRAITPGLPLFLYNYSTHQLHGIFEAASFGGTNIDPTAWEDKKNPGESRFHMASSDRAVALVASTLVSLLQVKFDGSAKSPFDTHPRTMLIAIAALLLYFVAYARPLRFFLSSASIANHCMVSSGCIFIASVSSMFLPGSVRPLLYGIGIAVSEPGLLYWLWKKSSKGCQELCKKHFPRVFDRFAPLAPMPPPPSAVADEMV